MVSSHAAQATPAAAAVAADCINDTLEHLLLHRSLHICRLPATLSWN